MINVIEQMFRDAVINAIEIINSAIEPEYLREAVEKYGLDGVVYDYVHDQLGLWMTGDLDDGSQLVLPDVSVQWIKNYINKNYRLNVQNEIVLK